MAFFCAADALAGATLEATGVAFPSSIAALLALGTVAPVAQRARRCSSPERSGLAPRCCRCCSFAVPHAAVVELPPPSGCRVEALAVGSLLATTAIAARLALGSRRAERRRCADVRIDGCGAAFLSSIPAAGCALMVGTARLPAYEQLRWQW